MFNLHLVGFLESISSALCLKMSLTQFSPKWGFSPIQVKPGFSPVCGLNLPTLNRNNIYNHIDMCMCLHCICNISCARLLICSYNKLQITRIKLLWNAFLYSFLTNIIRSKIYFYCFYLKYDVVCVYLCVCVSVCKRRYIVDDRPPLKANDNQ